MIEQQTAPPRRGRPPTGAAKTPAERQAARRARQLQRLAELEARAADPEAKAAPAPADPAVLAKLEARIAELNAENDRLMLRIVRYERLEKTWDHKTRDLCKRLDAATWDHKTRDLCKRLDAATVERDTAKSERLEANTALALAREEIKRLNRESRK